MLITIITPTYNSEKYLYKNILSVMQQTHKNIEHIFIDNKSSDTTKQILESYKNEAKYKVKIFSKKDKGIYYAFNKGINSARGDIVTILNSDDFFSNSNVVKSVDNFFKEKNVDFIYGNIKIVSRNNPNKNIRIWKTQKINNNEFYKIPHPSFFLKRSFQKKNNIIFDTKFKISSDLDFIINCFKNTKYFLHINKNLVIQRSGGTSQKLVNILIANYEVYKILLKHKITNRLMFIAKKIFFKICQLKKN